MGTKTVVVALVLLALVNRSLTHTPCHLFNCGQPPVCSYGLTRVGCLGCCFGCLKGPGDICGGSWYQRGICAKGLECRGTEYLDDNDGICVSKVPSGEAEVKHPPQMTKQPSYGEELLFQVASRQDENDKPFIIECEAEGEPAPVYRWMKNGEEFDWQTYDKRMSQLPGKGTLVITSPRDEDLGRYHCFAKNQLGTATSNSVFVRKSELNSFKNQDHITKTVNEGDPTGLKCQPPYGYPKPQVYWLIQDDRGALQTINSSRMTVDPEGTLWFTNVIRNDESKNFTYTCTATSTFRNEYKLGNRVHLRVNSTGSTAVQSKNEPTQQFVSRKNTVIMKGKTLQLWCIYSGTPLPEIRWKKPGGPLLHYQDQYEHHGKSLIIKYVDYEDAGTYECEISNGVGIAKSYTMNVQVEAAPYFITVPEIQNKAAGEVVEFHCETAGNPPPEQHWVFNGMLLEKTSHNPRRTVSNNKITIINLTKEDTGNYGCNSSNTHGYVYEDVYVNVLDDDCSHNCTADWNPVCGSDGKTYGNECQLKYASCRNPSDNIAVSHKGDCHDDCSYNCTADWDHVCGTDGTTYVNECQLNYTSCRNPSDNIAVAHKGDCHDDCSRNCTADWDPVCGIDGTTYGNECQLNYASCRNPSDNIDVAHKGDCRDDCSHNCTADWDPVCGSDGRAYNNACLLNYVSCRNPSDNIVVAHKGICRTYQYSNYACNCDRDSYSPVCGSDGNTYSNECFLCDASYGNPPANIVVAHQGICHDDCSYKCKADWDHVCGSDGTTYSNECQLNYVSCRNHSDNIVVVHKGKCDDVCSHICTADWDRVCGSDGTTYDNECLLNYASCRNPSDNIAAAYKGICLDDCSHNCTADWDPICGSDGISYENECLLNYASCRNENIVAAHKGICPNLCPEGYFTVGKQCFTGRERGSDMTWNEAQEECKKEGGFLPEPISIPDFQKAVQSQYKKSYGFWLGGSYRKQEGVWSWSSDGTLVGNSGGWYPGHHSKYGKGEHCISMETRWNQQTNARPCDKRYNFVVCEKRKILVHPGTCPPSHKECSDAHKGLSIHIPQICSDDAECRFYSKCCFDKCLDHHTCKPAQDFAFGIFTGNKDTIALSIDRK